MLKDNDRSEEAMDIATCILIALKDTETDPVIAQASLGNGWYRICKGIGYSPKTFWEMCNGLGEMYEKSANDGKTDT
jgi:hypothetical protein